MREHGQLYHDVASTHDRLRHQVDLTTPATLKHNYLMAQTSEQHQKQHQRQHHHQQRHQDRHRAHQLERREAAVLQLVPPRVRRHRRLWRAKTTSEALYQTVQGQQHHEVCEHHHDHINDKHQLALLTRRREHQPRPTGPASTSPRHYEHFAATRTTCA